MFEVESFLEISMQWKTRIFFMIASPLLQLQWIDASVSESKNILGGLPAKNKSKMFLQGDWKCFQVHFSDWAFSRTKERSSENTYGTARLHVTSQNSPDLLLFNSIHITKRSLYSLAFHWAMFFYQWIDEQKQISSSHWI